MSTEWGERFFFRVHQPVEDSEEEGDDRSSSESESDVDGDGPADGDDNRRDDDYRIGFLPPLPLISDESSIESDGSLPSLISDESSIESDGSLPSLISVESSSSRESEVDNDGASGLEEDAN